MSLLELYPQLKLAHIGFVLGSGTLFVVRGIGTFAGAGWPRSLPVRRLSVAIDTGLLAAALALLAALRLNPFAVAWLSTKLAMLVPYIVLGALALGRARTMRVRVLCFAAALACFGFIVSVAVTHDPLGALRWWP